ncbi:hypothetical protein HMPREF1212_02676 [Parabacteroides sp. HGS0025]|uniref:outer membrane beta-barrel protein n=1 Tax=Parabacteroides sp. HGS0025 TaxID=1078087 RepID=UPI0006170986|nr:outer membrane beta-barrel protein [Parabacteroides sp. HGS0025]KKB51938.1 hypothetical protein HMPREF1212_02676 [Parabacteroides sp. HGS0025]
MKKLVLTMMVAFIAIISANAQIYVGGSFNLTHNKNADLTNFTIAPEVGYNLNKTWAIAAEIGYTHLKEKGIKANAFNFAPYARFSFFERGIVRLFLDGGVGISTSKVEGNDSNNGFEIGIKPGIALEICKNLTFVTKYGFAGYRDDYKYSNSTSGVSLGSEDLSFGFHYEF